MSARSSNAMRLLGRLKARGAVRRQLRKLKTVKGAVLTFIGVAIFVLWIGNAIFAMSRRGVSDPEGLSQRVALGALVLTCVSTFTALAHHGLFIPKEEIERLFAAPISRSDIIRYRLRANAVRSLLGAFVVSAMVMLRMPRPGFAFVGVMLGMQTLPVLHQLMSILLGCVESRLAKRLQAVAKAALVVAVVSAMIFAVGLGALGARDGSGSAGALERMLALTTSLTGPVQHPALSAATDPFFPWVAMITATTLESFVLWLAVCGAILFALVEVTARLPIDFRELSLATSANVASRIRRARRGGGAAAGKVSRRMVAWRIPWIFGHGPMRAIAWRKSGAILRKARGTIVVSILVLTFVTLLARTIGDDAPIWVAPAVLGGFGTIYLCAGLRFDFRDELDRMEVIKAWPVGPARLFLGMLLPETCLVAALIVAAMFISAGTAGSLDPITWGMVLCVPPVVLAWVALDNAVFLFAPVRFVPGQEGALQNAGRSVILLLLRAIVLGLVGGIGAAVFAGVHFGLTDIMRVSERAALFAGFASLACVLVTLDGILVWIGGKMLARFDVARDRG